MSADIEQKMDRILDFLEKGARAQASVNAAGAGPSSSHSTIDEDALYQRFKARLLEESPGLIKVLTQKPEINVEVERHTITADGKSALGLLALLIGEGFFDDRASPMAAWKEMQRRGFAGISARVYEQLPKLTQQGFLTKESKDSYRSVKEMKVNIVGKK